MWSRAHDRALHEAARERAANEIDEITEAFENYLAGKQGPWLVYT